METDILLLSFAIVVTGLAAGVLPFVMRWDHVTAHRWIAFGAGAILGVAFLHMIPEAFELAGAGALPAILMGFLTLYVLELVSLDHPHDESRGELHEIGLLTFIGLTMHDLIDGVALGSGHHTPHLTPAIFAALVLHKIPTTFSLSVLMIHGGYRRSRILLFLAVVLLAIPAGAMFADTVLPFLAANPETAIGRLIFYSAGTFLYIGAYELLPEMHRQSGPESRIALFFLMGLALMAVLKLLHPVF